MVGDWKWTHFIYVKRAWQKNIKCTSHFFHPLMSGDNWQNKMRFLWSKMKLRLLPYCLSNIKYHYPHWYWNKWQLSARCKNDLSMTVKYFRNLQTKRCTIMEKNVEFYSPNSKCSNYCTHISTSLPSVLAMPVLTVECCILLMYCFNCFFTSTTNRIPHSVQTSTYH